MQVVRRVAIVLGGIALVILALIGFLTQVRGTPVRAVRPAGLATPLPMVGDSLFSRTLELLVGTKLEAGNRIEVLSNGDETYSRFWADLRTARRTITAQNYYSQPGAVADTFAKVLAERARAGVRVLVLLDAFGSKPLLDHKPFMDTLENAGVIVRSLRPLRWLSLHKAAQRSHSRAFVIDGVIGFTGGFGLADYWLGNGRVDGQWREANVRFEGPAVSQLQAAFVSSWAEATGELLVTSDYFPPAVFEERGNVPAALIHTMPTIGSTPAERMLALTIAGARRTLFITNSYFVPDTDLRRMMIQAVGRGADVRVLTAGEKTDVKITWWAGRRFYDELLEGGVRIYEYEPSMMHSKAIVVDGLWLTIGSMNFDNRSIAFNNETNLIALDPVAGATMDSLFREDIRHSREINLEDWRRRGWWRRPLERAAGMMSRIL